ncbi:hypothetical protein EV368DRAFT_88543 [Lentinula lateritia]|nr:hypothetical protein EV368DRAFT_88543 [Lentinula lateritia]
MTATPAASKELNYMLAHIEDDKLVEDPDDPTFDFGGPGNNFNFFIAPIRKQRLQIHHKWVPEKSFPVLSDWRKTRIPSVLVIHNGPNVQALGAVYLTNQYVEVLSPSLPLYFSEFTKSQTNTLLNPIKQVFLILAHTGLLEPQFSSPTPTLSESFGSSSYLLLVLRVIKMSSSNLDTGLTDFRRIMQQLNLALPQLC